MDGPDRAPCDVHLAGQGVDGDGEIDQDGNSNIGLNMGLDMGSHADNPESNQHINENNRGNDGATETSAMHTTETIPDVEEEM